MRMAMRLTVLAATLLCRASDLGQLQELYRGILRSKDDASLSKPESLLTQNLEDSLKTLTPDDARALLPLASQCLEFAQGASTPRRTEPIHGNQPAV